jgi:hypothetical protein
LPANQIRRAASSFFVVIQYFNLFSAKISVIPANPQNGYKYCDWTDEIEKQIAKHELRRSGC